MSKHIDLLISSPPSLDFPTYVGTQDEFGAPVQVGKWIEPSADQPFWILRLTPAELLMYMIADRQDQQVQVATERFIRHNPPLIDNLPGGVLPVTSARAALKARLAGAKPKQPASQPAPVVDPRATEKCPACHQMYDPAQYGELVDCSTCGEAKCTAHCFESIAAPCLDCQALQASPEEGGFEAPEQAEIKTPELRAAMQDGARGAAAAVGSRLFDGVHHGPQGKDSAPDDDD